MMCLFCCWRENKLKAFDVRKRLQASMEMPVVEIGYWRQKASAHDMQISRSNHICRTIYLRSIVIVNSPSPVSLMTLELSIVQLILMGMSEVGEEKGVNYQRLNSLKHLNFSLARMTSFVWANRVLAAIRCCWRPGAATVSAGYVEEGRPWRGPGRHLYRAGQFRYDCMARGCLFSIPSRDVRRAL